jgi:hypothetical protein
VHSNCRVEKDCVVTSTNFSRAWSLQMTSLKPTETICIFRGNTTVGSMWVVLIVLGLLLIPLV